MAAPLNRLTEKTSLVIRADANSRIGTGHVMRCIALGQAWQDAAQRSETGGQATGSVVFITCCDNPALLQRLRDENFTVVELKRPNEFLARLSSDLGSPTSDLRPPISGPWLVLDGYQFTIDDHRALRAAGYRLLVIDDCCHLPDYECDILLNQNVNAFDLNYQVNPDCRKLLGPDYVLLRREFINVDAMSSSRPAEGERGGDPASVIGNNLLVTMGGADPDNATLSVIHALEQLNRADLDIRVVVGPANPHRAVLETAVQRSACSIQLIHSANMVELMRWADFAVSAAGSTCWELLSIGTPFATVILADNQEGVARYLEEKGGIHCFGWVTPQFESQVADFFRGCQPNPAGGCSPSIIDGLGSRRVVAQMKKESV